MRKDLSFFEAQIVSAIAESPIAWRTVDQLATSLGWSADETEDRLADLGAGGWLAAWEEWPQGIAVTFTPWAAEQLGLRIVEQGPHETPRWASLNSPDPRPIKVRRVFRDAEALDLVVDPSPGPEELAELAEQVQTARRRISESPGVWPDARREAERAEKARRKRKKAKGKRKCSSARPGLPRSGPRDRPHP